jgi:hypothetical protein
LRHADCCPRFHRPALAEGSAQVHHPLVRRRPARRVHAYRPQRQYCHRLVRRHFARPRGRTHISAHFVLPGVQYADGRRPGVNQDPPQQGGAGAWSWGLVHGFYHLVSSSVGPQGIKVKTNEQSELALVRIIVVGLYRPTLSLKWPRTTSEGYGTRAPPVRLYADQLNSPLLRGCGAKG